jgi:hypothetical protein
MKVITETFPMKVITETFPMKVITETLKVLESKKTKD